MSVTLLIWTISAENIRVLEQKPDDRAAAIHKPLAAVDLKSQDTMLLGKVHFRNPRQSK